MIPKIQIDRIDTPSLAIVRDEPPKYRLKLEAGFFIMPPEVFGKISVQGNQCVVLRKGCCRNREQGHWWSRAKFFV